MSRIVLGGAPQHYAAGKPQSACFVCGEARWTWIQLSERAQRCAEALYAQGVRSDDFVAFALPNGPEFAALTFAIYRLGATPAPLSPRLSPRELKDILALLKPAAFVTPDWTPCVGVALPVDEIPVAKSWKACTSGGSTGRPKVIVDARPSAVDLEESFLDLPRDDVVIVPGPLYHNAPFSNAVLALARGNRVATMPRFDPEAFLALVEAERVTWALMVPTMMHRVWRLPAGLRGRYDLSSLRIVAHTAAPMPQWLKAAWIDWLGADRIWEVYGATEGLMRTWIGGREWLERPGSVGRACGGAQVKIKGPGGEEVPWGEFGEVFIMPAGGAGSTYRYIGAQARRDEEGWESLGDLGRIDADGYLYLADRRSDLIISGGVNIYPAEIECALLEHPSIASCAVVGVPNDDLGAAVHAVIESQDASLDLAAVRAFLADRLSAVKHPRSIELRSGPVRDDAGKVRRDALAPS